MLRCSYNNNLNKNVPYSKSAASFWVPILKLKSAATCFWACPRPASSRGSWDLLLRGSCSGICIWAFLCKAELKVRVLSGLLAVAPLNSCQLTRSLPCAWLFQAQIKIIRKMGAVQTTVRWQAAWTGRIGAKAPGNCEIPYIGGWVKRWFFSRTCDMTVIYFAPKTIPLIVLNNTT